MKKILWASLVLLILECLSLGVFINGTFSRTPQPIAPVLRAASHIDSGAAKFESHAKTAVRFVLEMYGELAPRSPAFLTAKEIGAVSLRRFIFVPLFRVILAPKVSRYVTRSVLNI
jgi:hypothetical protein